MGEHRCEAMKGIPAIVMMAWVDGEKRWVLYDEIHDIPNIRYCPFCGVELREGENGHE